MKLALEKMGNSLVTIILTLSIFLLTGCSDLQHVPKPTSNLSQWALFFLYDLNCEMGYSDNFHFTKYDNSVMNLSGEKYKTELTTSWSKNADYSKSPSSGEYFEQDIESTSKSEFPWYISIYCHKEIDGTIQVLTSSATISTKLPWQNGKAMKNADVRYWEAPIFALKVPSDVRSNILEFIETEGNYDPALHNGEVMVNRDFSTVSIGLVTSFNPNQPGYIYTITHSDIPNNQSNVIATQQSNPAPNSATNQGNPTQASKSNNSTVVIDSTSISFRIKTALQSINSGVGNHSCNDSIFCMVFHEIDNNLRAYYSGQLAYMAQTGKLCENANVTQSAGVSLDKDNEYVHLDLSIGSGIIRAIIQKDIGNSIKATSWIQLNVNSDASCVYSLSDTIVLEYIIGHFRSMPPKTTRLNQNTLDSSEISLDAALYNVKYVIDDGVNKGTISFYNNPKSDFEGLFEELILVGGKKFTIKGEYSYNKADQMVVLKPSSKRKITWVVEEFKKDTKGFQVKLRDKETGKVTTLTDGMKSE